jgi:hypothetical protein
LPAHTATSEPSWRAAQTTTGRIALALALIVAAAGCGGSAAGLPVVSNLPVTQLSSLAWQQPDLAINPSDRKDVAVAYDEGTLYESQICGLALSTDGGRTWKPQVLVGVGGRFSLPNGLTHCNGARLAYGPTGTLYYVYEAGGGGGGVGLKLTYPYLITYDSKTGSFAAPVEVDPTTPVSNASGPATAFDILIAVDQTSGHVYMSWYSNLNKAVIARSTDGGKTFTPPAAATPPSQAFTQPNSLSIGPDRTVYLGWTDFTDNSNGCGTTPRSQTCPGIVYVASSRDAGMTFANVASLGTVNLGCPGHDVLAQYGLPTNRGPCDPLHADGYPFYLPVQAGPKAGQVYAAWYGGDPQQPSRLFFAWSTNSGASWSTGRTVGATPGSANDQQWLPRLSVASNGRIDLAYYDRQADGTQDVDLISSSDGGRTFTSPRKINNQPSPVTVGHVSFNGISFGTFLGAVAEDQSTSIAWTDSRQGTTENGVQSIYFSTVASRI